MPPKKSNLNNSCSKEARRKRFERAHQSAEQIAARNALQRIRIATSRARERERQQTSHELAREDLIMAESGNLKENQNKMVNEVDVQHRYYAQTITFTGNINDLRPKTVAERVRARRARKKMKIQEVKDVSIIQQKLKKCRKIAAERMREYRARKRNKIQAASGISSSDALVESENIIAYENIDTNQPQTARIQDSPNEDTTQVALSRVTSIQGLYVTTQDNKNIFCHGRRTASSTIELQTEYKRLSQNKLVTINENLLNFINSRKDLSLFTFNCQSLRSHVNDLNDSLIRNCNVLVLCKTWLADEDNISVPNFNCIIKYKRPYIRAGAVDAAIFHNSNDVANILTSSADDSVIQSDLQCIVSSTVGDLCMTQCRMENGQKIVIVAVYISPNQNLDDIIDFLHHSLLQYTTGGTALLRKDNDIIPMILSGYFNVNFASDKSTKLVKFLKDTLNLSMQSNPQISTTKSNTTIDAVFARFLHLIECKTSISYFSYHKPLITKVYNNSVVNEVE